MLLVRFQVTQPPHRGLHALIYYDHQYMTKYGGLKAVFQPGVYSQGLRL